MASIFGKKFKTYDELESILKKNKSLAPFLLVLGLLFAALNASENFIKLYEFAANSISYIKNFRSPVLTTIDDRLREAKIEAVNYKIASSEIVVAKFITYPMLNNFNQMDDDWNLSIAIMTSISPFKATNVDRVFDGGDCRFTIKADRFSIALMNASFKITGITCIDNDSHVYELSSDASLGYLAVEQSVGINRVSVIDHDRYLMPNPNQSYVIQFYEPISTLEYKGVSAVGRF